MTSYTTIHKEIRFTPQEQEILTNAWRVVDDLDDIMTDERIDSFNIREYGEVSRDEIGDIVNLLHYLATCDGLSYGVTEKSGE